MGLCSHAVILGGEVPQGRRLLPVSFIYFILNILSPALPKVQFSGCIFLGHLR